MRLTGITVQNFGPYYGKHVIKFDKIDADRRIWLFQGLTGAGKTSLFLALIWALYGEDGVKEFTKRTNAERRRTIDLICKKAKDEGRPNMAVELYFEHQGENCTLIRRVVPKRPQIQSTQDIDVTVSFSRSGTEEEFPEEKISEILPRDASQFFFFDGEQVRRYAEPSSNETKEALENILGIPVIKAARDNIQYVLTDINRDITDIKNKNPSDEDIASWIRAVQIKELEVKNIEEKIRSLKSELSTKEQEREDISSRLANMEVVKLSMERIKHLENLVKSNDESIDYERQKKRELRDDLPFVLIRDSFETVISNFKQKRGEDDIRKIKYTLEIKLKFLEDVLKNGICICGNSVYEAEKSAIQTRIDDCKNQIRNIDQKLAVVTIPSLEELNTAYAFIVGKKVNFEEIDSRIAKLELENANYQKEIKRLRDEVKSSNIEEVAKLEIKIEELESDISNLKVEISVQQRQRDDDIRTIEKVKTSIARAQSYSPIVNSLLEQWRYGEKIENALEYIINKLIPEKKKLIEIAASEALRNMLRKSMWTGIKIEDDFGIRTISQVGYSDDYVGSAGENEIVALSFILGLTRAADREAPIVTDFLFGRLDGEYRDSIIETLPSFSNQVIVFKIQNGELTDSQTEKLRKLCAGEFEIKYDENTQTSSIRRIS
jgi:DNA sulfur modification protein DndD